MRVLINAVSAKMGGSATYAVNLARALAAMPPEHEYIFYVPTKQAEQIHGLAAHVRVVGIDIGYAPSWRRILWDQWTLRRLLWSKKIDLLFSTSNFAMFLCPCRQILLVRNSLYFSPLYRKHIFPRKKVREKLGFLLRRKLICLSALWADAVMTPSQGMLAALRQFVALEDRKAVVNHYGTNAEKFSLPRNSPGGTFLYVTYYADYKNLSTVLEALVKLNDRRVDFRFITTADILGFNPARSTTYGDELRLLERAGVRDRIAWIGLKAHDDIQALYCRSDILLFASLTESFGHPLIEAMAAGVAILTSDIPVHREICGEAALYFDPLDPDSLAEKMQTLIENSGLRIRLAANGRKRANLFRFQDHVERLIGIFNLAFKG